jgi:hypothetical protein
VNVFVLNLIVAALVFFGFDCTEHLNTFKARTYTELKK